MRVLLTGGSGMLGRALKQNYQRQAEVIGVSKSGSLGTRRCDLTSPESVSALFREPLYDLVIHTAAYSDVDGCERDPKLAHESNAMSTCYLAQACGSTRTPFIYISTDYVFDGHKDTPYAESDITSPINVYGLTKLEGEYFTKRFAPVSAVVRTSWLFGEGNPSSFVNAIADRLRKDKVVRVLADQTDSPTSVKDLSAAVQKIGDYLIESRGAKRESPLQEIFQVCNTGETTRYQMTVKMKEWMGLREVQVERLDSIPADNRPALRPKYAAMSTKHYETFFETRLRRWEDSLKEYIGGLGV